MVYCTRCGTLNPDTAINCSNCGATINNSNAENRPYDRREQRHRYYEERYRNYGRGRGFGLLIGGLFVILIAIGLIYGVVWQFFWPIVLVIIGIWLIAMFLTRNRRYSRQPLPT
jgi:uncharacterized membrane protein YvbJ